MPVPIKIGNVGFKCTCRACFTGYVCPENIIMSMIFDKELVVPDKYNAVQIKERQVGALGVIPFNIEARRAEVAKKMTKANDDDGPQWNATIEGHVASPPRPHRQKAVAARRRLVGG